MNIFHFIPSFSLSWIDFKEIYFIGLFKETDLDITSSLTAFIL